MVRAILASLRQVLCGRGFFISFIGTAIILFLSSIQGMLAVLRQEELLAFGYHHGLVIFALSSDAMALALPILCTLPYTTSFIDDVKSGFIKAYLHRTTCDRYIASKAAVCALSGGLVLVLGILITYGIASLLFMPLEAMPEPSADSPGYFKQLMETLLMFFASGALWAMVGLAFAALTNSRYMAYASPFVVCYILIILYERYFDFLYVLYPREWLNPSDKWVFGSWGVAILLIVLTGVIGCIFAYWARRQLVQE